MLVEELGRDLDRVLLEEHAVIHAVAEERDAWDDDDLVVAGVPRHLLDDAVDGA